MGEGEEMYNKELKGKLGRGPRNRRREEREGQGTNGSEDAFCTRTRSPGRRDHYIPQTTSSETIIKNFFEKLQHQVIPECLEIMASKASAPQVPASHKGTPLPHTKTPQ